MNTVILKQKGLLLWSYKYTATVSLYSFLYTTPSPVVLLQIIWLLLGHLWGFHSFAFGGVGSQPICFSVCTFSFKNFFPALPFVFLIFVLSMSIFSLFLFLLPSIHSLSQFVLLFLLLFLPLHLVLASDSAWAPSVLWGSVQSAKVTSRVLKINEWVEIYVELKKQEVLVAILTNVTLQYEDRRNNWVLGRRKLGKLCVFSLGRTLASIS